jgi:hypothetical protein
MWEKICLGYAASKEDYGVKDFFYTTAAAYRKQ